MVVGAGTDLVVVVGVVGTCEDDAVGAAGVLVVGVIALAEACSCIVTERGFALLESWEIAAADRQ